MIQDQQLALHDAIHNLLTALSGIQAFQEETALESLLQNLPGRELVVESKIPATRLMNIVVHAANNGKSALEVLQKNVVYYLRGQESQTRKINECFAALEATLLAGRRDTFPERDSPHLMDANVLFSNRETELALILTVDRPPTHHIIDAPTGYGKTKLLQRLEEVFKSPQQNCLCVHVSGKTNKTLLELMVALCKGLDLDTASVVAGDIRAAAVQLAQEILKVKFPDSEAPPKRQSLVLLLDDIDPLKPDLARPLLEILIPSMEETLRTSRTYFRTKSNAFRVIMAGRNLAKFVNSLIPGLPWVLNTIALTPFDYKVVWDTARDFLTESENVEQTAAHILHLTGGHPYCMARALNFYKTHPCAPETFLQLYSQQIWAEFVKDQTEVIRSSLPTHLLPICDRLSVFRIFNLEILQYLLKSTKLDYPGDCVTLENELLETHLYDRTPVRFVRDAIVRRMLVMRLRHGENAGAFTALCGEAYNMCLSLLNRNDGAQIRDTLAIECMFQALQGHADPIGTSHERISLRQRFFESTVPEVLGAFLASSERETSETYGVNPHAQRKRELEALVSEMNQKWNWDFRFSVNYYLREASYNENPFGRLVDFVRSWQRRGD